MLGIHGVRHQGVGSLGGDGEVLRYGEGIAGTHAADHEGLGGLPDVMEVVRLEADVHLLGTVLDTHQHTGTSENVQVVQLGEGVPHHIGHRGKEVKTVIRFGVHHIALSFKSAHAHAQADGTGEAVAGAHGSGGRKHLEEASFTEGVRGAGLGFHPPVGILGGDVGLCPGPACHAQKHGNGEKKFAISHIG